MLTDLQAKKSKPAGRDYKLADSGGLYLYVTTTGFKSWRLKYRFGGKEKRLVFGPYPEVSLSEARDRRTEAKRLLRSQVDPQVQIMKARLAAAADQKATFAALAREWHAQQKSRWTPIHADDVLNSLERDVFPSIGSLPIREIEAPIVLAVLRKIEARGSLETAKRVRQRMSAVFIHALAQGIECGDPAAVVAKALVPARKAGRQPAMVKVEDLQDLLRAAEQSAASPVTKIASRLLALTAVRPGVLRGAAWAEFHGIDWTSGLTISGEEPLWCIPAARMKLLLDRKEDEAFDHLVPLSRQAVEALLAIRPLTARLPFIFPSERHLHRSISENAIGYLYNRVGYHGRHVPHGWRAAFSTIMNERAERAERPGDRAIIDLMLAHVPANRVESAYNRAAFMDRRRELAQVWADLLLDGIVPASQLLIGPRR